MHVVGRCGKHHEVVYAKGNSIDILVCNNLRVRTIREDALLVLNSEFQKLNSSYQIKIFIGRNMHLYLQIGYAELHLTKHN